MQRGLIAHRQNVWVCAGSTGQKHIDMHTLTWIGRLTSRAEKVIPLHRDVNLTNCLV